MVYSKAMSENIVTMEQVTWNTVETLLRKILSGASLSEEEHAELTKSVRRYCGKRTTKALTLPRCMGLYLRLRCFLEKHIKYLKNIALTLSHSDLLSFYEESWLHYSEMMECIHKHFRYASRLCFSTQDSSHGDGFYQIGLSAWHSGLFGVCRKELTKTILEEILEERRGKQLSIMRLPMIMTSFITEEDKNYFESEFLKTSAEFYATQNFIPSAPLTVADYFEWVESIIQYEIGRSSSYLKESTLKNLKNIVSKKLIEDTIEIISEEFSNLVNEEKIEKLSKLSGFLLKYENDLKYLAFIFESYVYDMGSQALSQVCEEAKFSPKIYVETINALLSKCDNFLQKAFPNNLSFTRAANKACERFINQNAITEVLGGSKKSPEILAKYSDMLLRKDFSSKIAGNMDKGLSLVIKVFSYVEDKDVFQRIYGNLLARRLVRNQFISEDCERCMINFLAEKCGYSYVTVFTQMLDDVKSSRELNKKYCEWLERRSEENGIPGLVNTTITVLRSCIRPFLPMNDLTIPSELENSMNSISEFYSSHFNRRKLLWCYNFCSGEITSHYTKKSYTFAVSAYQMAILMLFNKADIYTIKQIRELTNIEENLLVPLLEIFLKTQILKVITDSLPKAAGSSTISESPTVADNKGIEKEEEKVQVYSHAAELAKNLPAITMATNLALCMEYHDDRIYVNLNIPVRRVIKQEEEKKEERRIESDRSMAIQCHIIRLMKARKRMTHRDLMKEMVEQSYPMFHPSTAQIKLSIGMLIERGFIRRDPDDMTTLEYID